MDGQSMKEKNDNGNEQEYRSKPQLINSMVTETKGQIVRANCKEAKQKQKSKV